jgi:hypothetical protein
LIVVNWEAAQAAIVEQRGEALARDIEKLLRERDLLTEPGGESCLQAWCPRHQCFEKLWGWPRVGRS